MGAEVSELRCEDGGGTTSQGMWVAPEDGAAGSRKLALEGADSKMLVQ